jgi:hypothetical protein
MQIAPTTPVLHTGWHQSMGHHTAKHKKQRKQNNAASHMT